ncbi:MAG: M28 family peptidase, partial [Proteobacteria bacterium]|nr:M28 family peptidase [Pseudomonadota bacterium]
KNRTAGSECVRACMGFMADQMKPWADEVHSEPFTLHRHPFVGSILLLALGGLIGIICFELSCLFSSLILAIISPIILAVSFILWFFEFVLYRQTIDFIFPKYNAINIFAERKAKIESRQRIIISGHADAAYEMTFFLKLKAWQIYTLIILTILGMISCFIIDIIHTSCAVTATTSLVFCIIEAFCFIVFIPWLFFINWKIIVDGANDNLTGCYIGMNILKEMAQTDERLDYTDVCCLITDGEESGLRGAIAYAKRHQTELAKSNTMVVAIDTIHDPKELAIYHRGINFTQQNSPDVCALLEKAAKSCNLHLPYTDFYPGATDAEAFSRYNIKAAAICAVQHSPTNYYHTRHDSWDNIVPECIHITQSLVKTAIQIYDEQID